MGTSHETLETETSTHPSLGYQFVVEHNEVKASPVCVLVNEHFTQVTSRGNQCPPGTTTTGNGGNE